MYLFGPFRLDPAKRVLLRGEDPVGLTPKAFDTLLLLVEKRDRVLLKDELMNRIWPESFVEESNLSQTIFILRKTLGETAQDQRYIVTVRGTGYRFAEPVREVPDPPASPPTVHSVPQGVSISSARSQARRFPRFALLIVLLMLGGLAIAGSYLWLRRTPKLTDKDTVVLSEFDNRTGDPIFDDTLKPALAIDLEQSPFLSLLPDQRVRATLKLMNRREDERVTRDVALEICQRADGKALITGSILSIGGAYVLSLDALDCRGGAVMASQQGRTRGKETVLDALSQAAVGLRKDLGESLASVRKFDTPLREATTPSLDALKAFNAGAEIVRHGPDQSAAIPFYTHAIELDPNFALAYAYLGRAFVNIGEYQRATPYLQKAYALRDRVSERERLLLTTFYHSDVTGDTDKEIEAYNVWIEEYPRDWLPVDSLATTYRFYFNEYDKAAELYRRSMELDPQQPFSPSGLALSYLALNRVQDARAVLNRAFSTGFDNGTVRAALYAVAVVQGDVVTEQQQAQWSNVQPVQDNFGAALFWTAAQRGRLGEAQAIVAHDARELREAGFNETAAWEYANLALIEASFLDPNDVRREAASSLALSRNWSNLSMLALAFALAGDSNQARVMARELEQRYSSNPSLQKFTIPCVQAAIAIDKKEFGAAVSLLEPLRRFDLGSLMAFQSLYLRGLAFLGEHDPAAAAAEFQTIIDHRGVAPLSPNWALAYLGLARARVLAGDAAGARSAYDQFLEIWKDADPAIPLLRKARQERLRLQ